MSNLNLFEMDKSQTLPSEEYLIRRKQSERNRLRREILSKEYYFKTCPPSEDIQKRIYEDELGDLYYEYMQPYRDALKNSQL